MQHGQLQPQSSGLCMHHQSLWTAGSSACSPLEVRMRATVCAPHQTISRNERRLFGVVGLHHFESGPRMSASPSSDPAGAECGRRGATHGQRATCRPAGHIMHSQIFRGLFLHSAMLSLVWQPLQSRASPPRPMQPARALTCEQRTSLFGDITDYRSLVDVFLNFAKTLLEHAHYVQN